MLQFFFLSFVILFFLNYYCRRFLNRTVDNQLNQRFFSDREADYTKGIFQSIGFKEFHEYLVMPSSEQTSDDDRRQQLLNEGIEALKVVTRRYARKQIKWIRNRFLKQPDRQVIIPTLFLFIPMSFEFIYAYQFYYIFIFICIRCLLFTD